MEVENKKEENEEEFTPYQSKKEKKQNLKRKHSDAVIICQVTLIYNSGISDSLL